MSMMDAALEYASRNWRVFPCVPGGKRPLVMGGFHSATTNFDVIRMWWQQWPEANVGFDISEELVVLDFDPRNGGERIPELPPTDWVSTPDGGFHLYYGVDPDRDPFIGRWRQGVDVKAAGKGYVLLPPSPGYAWGDRGNIAPLPQWLLDEITRKPVEIPVTTNVPHWMAKGKASGIIRKVRNADNGSRNNLLYWATCRLLDGGLATDDVLYALFDAAVEAGLTQDETMATMDSARRRSEA